MSPPPADLVLQLTAARSRQPRAVYPDALRDQTLAWVRARTREGCSQGAIARALGLPQTTLSRWTSGSNPETPEPTLPASEPAFRPVQCIGVSNPGLTLHTPNGYRVEGLDLPALAELLGRLG